MLEIEALNVILGRRRVLENIHLAVNAGEVLVVAGPNGAGKSTLVRAISGALPVASGQVHINGKDVSRLKHVERARCMAVVPQARNLPGAFTVYESVLLGRTPYLGFLGQPRPADHDGVKRALERTCCVELAARPVGELSGGEQQRVLLARALAQDTPVLLLDEPTTFLDIQHQAGLLNLVRSLAAERQIAVLMVLHDLNLAGLYADRVALLANGRIQAVGAPAEVLTEHNLSQVYRVPVHVMPHPEYGSPLILPDGRGGLPGHSSPRPQA
ncbi:MAG: heme ABC transporter ATP-binding protein [Chloroflexota bacterium]